MKTDRDPALESLFAIARQDAVDDDFANQLMAKIDGLRRRAMIGWASVGVAMLAALSLMAGPLTHAASFATQLLPETLVDIDDRLFAQLLAPVNSIAGAAGLGFLLLRLAYKKIFG